MLLVLKHLPGARPAGAQDASHCGGLVRTGLSIAPWPINAIRSIQSSTAGVASGMLASTEVRTRVKHSGWYTAKSVMHGMSPTGMAVVNMSERQRK
jgi:hypothetical protein